MNWREYQSLQKVAEVDGRFVSYVDEGEGDPVVLLHGIPTWGYLWHRWLPALSPTRRVLIPDLPGFGYSDKSDTFDRGIGRQAETIDLWLDQLGVESATIVGHDIGGGIALRLATLFPERVSRLCLMNSVCYDSWPVELMLQLGHPEAYRKMSAGAAVTMLRPALKMAFASSPADELLDGLLAPYSTEVGKLSLIRNAAALNTNLTTELTPLLSRIAAPTLIVWGEDDKIQTVKYAERLASDIPQSTLVRLRDARHFVMIDQHDAAAKHVTAFITRSAA
jgi:pimeloyl-ACP methyl ester carboxylesterase